VWVEGIQRIVCGVTEKTTCQDIVYALAHATGRTGRFTLIERWRNNERLLAPQEHPLQVIKKWGEYSYDVQFILQRSPLDPNKSSSSAGPSTSNNTSSQQQNTTADSDVKSAPWLGETGKTAPGGIWKSPPTTSAVNNRIKPDAARLSPDSGQGSDPTGSDSSNFSSDVEKSKSVLRSSHQLPPSGYQPQGWPRTYKSSSPDQYPPYAEYGYSRLHSQSSAASNRGPPVPPAYRHPPIPGGSNGSSSTLRNPSPSGVVPPPYRDPPPPPGSHARGGPPVPTSPTQLRRVSGSPNRAAGASGLPPMNMQPHSPTPPRGGYFSGRPPHYSPPPVHKELRGGMHKSGSPGRSLSGRSMMSPARGHTSPLGGGHRPNWIHDNYADLQSLVSAQKTRIQSQQAEIVQCENEMRVFSGSGGVDYLPSQLEAVIAEVRRLEEAANQNESELQDMDVTQGGAGVPGVPGAPPNGIRNELDQLKHRLEMTDLELQKTNATLRRLGDEMRSYSQERSKEREVEIKSEISSIEQEIKQLQRCSEDSTVISDKLNREQKEIDQELSQRKQEVDKLMKEMKSLNLESLTISPPEENKSFMEGPMGKPGSVRKMLGSPRQLENAVPTSKNPHGVWV